MIFLQIITAIFIFGTLPGTLELFFLTIGALFPHRKQRHTKQLSGRLVVVVPAHNEEKAIKRILVSLKKNQEKFDVVVIADNCADNTEKISSEHGARVIIRKDQNKKGKNYALDFAFSILLEEGYSWFVVVDADTVVQANFIKEIKLAFANGAEAVQTRYGVLNPDETFRTRIMNIAFLAFNYLRPRARSRWGISSGILGNGFALSRKVLNNVPYDVESIVEDLVYHLRLVKAGYRVDFLDITAVFGEMPTGEKGIITQRTRWEEGRFREIVNYVPILLKEIIKGRFDLIEPLLELLLLPLSYHVILLFILLMIPMTVAQVFALISLGVVGFHLIVALIIGGGKVKDFIALLFVPYYIIWKFGFLLYMMNPLKKRSGWKKTERF